MRPSYLVEALAAMPGLVREPASRIDAGTAGRPTGPGRFSPVEVLAHLADWEPIFRARMEQAARSPGLPVQAYDEGERAERLDYAAWPIERSLAQWAEERSETVRFLEALAGAGWACTVLHPERGELTVLQQAATLVGHDVYHLAQLETVSPRG
jgi:hypothetical protein